MSDPRGVQEQVSAISDLIEKKPEQEAEAGQEPEEQEPEQAAPDESHEEGDVEAGSEATDEEPEEGSYQGGEIRTLAEFAKAAGWEPQDFYGLTMKLDNGEEVPLGQVKDTLQAHARERAELNAARQHVAQEYQRIQQMERQIAVGQQQVSQAVQEAQGRVAAAQERFNAVNWEELAQQDPGRAAYLQQQIAVEYSAAKADFDKAIEQQNVARYLSFQRVAAEENEKFLNAVPEWRDPAVAQAGQQRLNDFLVGKVGFSPDELATVHDARARVIALMAMRWFEHANSVAKTAGKVRSAPKPVLTPSARPAAPVEQRKTDALVQKAKTTQKRGDQVAAVSALLNIR